MKWLSWWRRIDRWLWGNCTNTTRGREGQIMLEDSVIYCACWSICRCYLQYSIPDNFRLLSESWRSPQRRRASVHAHEYVQRVCDVNVWYLWYLLTNYLHKKLFLLLFNFKSEKISMLNLSHNQSSHLSHYHAHCRNFSYREMDCSLLSWSLILHSNPYPNESVANDWRRMKERRKVHGGESRVSPFPLRRFNSPRSHAFWSLTIFDSRFEMADVDQVF